MLEPTPKGRHYSGVGGAGALAVILGGGWTGSSSFSFFSNRLDLETGDGIVQAGSQDTANKLRTAPLWGLRMRPRFMHDLKSLTPESAIERHKGEAEDVTDRFFDLTEAQKQQLFTFLNSL